MVIKPLCITVFVFGGYTKYIPYYVYSVLKSYPHYYVKVFTNKVLSNKESSCLQMIKKRQSKNFEVKEKYLANIKFNKRAIGKVQRYLIPYEEFKDFENVYIGDVDFLIIEEDPQLLEAHLNHCQKTGLPYSNQIRPTSRRLSGLHFFKVKEYYEKMNNVIEYYLNNHSAVVNKFKKIKRDEEFLYIMIKQNIGFDKLDVYHYRPHHGFHLSILRSGSIDSKDYVKSGFKNNFYQLPKYHILKKKLLAFYNDSLFQDIMQTNSIDEIIKLKKQLKKY